jgi:hypothetical protein
MKIEERWGPMKAGLSRETLGRVKSGDRSESDYKTAALPLS